MNRISHEINFHDSSLLRVEFPDRLNCIQFILYAPHALGQHCGGFYEIRCDAVLRFEYEVLDVGELEQPPEIYEVYLMEEGEEYHRWKQRLAVLAEPDSFGNPGIDSIRDGQVYHVVLASSCFEGWGKNEYLDGIWIICRRVTIRDVSSEWSDEDRIEPKTIPAAIEKKRTIAKHRRDDSQMGSTAHD
jgi:hypothetical protein